MEEKTVVWYGVQKEIKLLRSEGLKWYWKIKKAQLIALVMRQIFCYNRLEMTIDTKPNGDKKIYIFDKDTMIDYEWIARLEDQRTVKKLNGTIGEYYRLTK